MPRIQVMFIQESVNVTSHFGLCRDPILKFYCRCSFKLFRKIKDNYYKAKQKEQGKVYVHSNKLTF